MRKGSGGEDGGNTLTRRSRRWCFLNKLFRRRHRARKILFTIGVTKGTLMLNLKVNDELSFTIQAADEFGNPTAANFDAPPAWTSSDDTVAAVAVAGDGLSAVITSPSGKLAGATIQVAGSVAGANVQGSFQLNMIAGDTAEITLVPGTPTAAPAPSATPSF